MVTLQEFIHELNRSSYDGTVLQAEVALSSDILDLKNVDNVKHPNLLDKV